MLDVQILVDERPFNIFGKVIDAATLAWKPEDVQAFIKEAQSSDIHHLLDTVKMYCTLFYIDVHGGRLPWPPP